MDCIQWIFDGLGTEILSLILGGFAGYKIGVRKNGTQKQVAKDGAKQRQELIIDGLQLEKEDKSVYEGVKQTQKAGNNAEQVQVGRISDGK